MQFLGCCVYLFSGLLLFLPYLYRLHAPREKGAGADPPAQAVPGNVVGTRKDRSAVGGRINLHSPALLSVLRGPPSPRTALVLHMTLLLARTSYGMCPAVHVYTIYSRWGSHLSSLAPHRTTIEPNDPAPPELGTHCLACGKMSRDVTYIPSIVEPL